MSKHCNSKKILLISPHFYPEDFKCNELAFELANRGYDVTALSDIPNYPQGVFYRGYGLFRRRCEIVNGVKVIRTTVIPRGNGSGKMLALNYLSFAFTACVRAFFMSVFCKYDTIIVHQTSPITVGLPALIIKKLRPKTKLLFWVLDLWPESLEVAGGISNQYILKIFEKIAKWCYELSDRILMSSKGFRKSICSKGDFAEKLIYFPNWADGNLAMNSEYELPYMPDGFKIMFAGNVGEAQDFEHTLEAFKILRDRGCGNIHFIIVGNGRKKEWVDEYVVKHNLHNTVHCLGRHPLESMAKFFEMADVLFLALKDSVIFNLTVPAKLQAYMSVGKPILAMLNGEGANIIEDAQCGVAVPAGNSECLVDAILKMYGTKRETLQAMGANSKRYCVNNFSFKKNISNIVSLIEG